MDGSRCLILRDDERRKFSPTQTGVARSSRLSLPDFGAGNRIASRDRRLLEVVGLAIAQAPVALVLGHCPRRWHHIWGLWTLFGAELERKNPRDQPAVLPVFVALDFVSDRHCHLFIHPRDCFPSLTLVAERNAQARLKQIKHKS